MQFVLPQLVDSVVGLVNDVPTYVSNASDLLDDLTKNLDLNNNIVEMAVAKWNEIVTYTINIVSNLLPVVGKLTDVRIVNNELKTMLGEVKKEYWMMVCLVVGNIPLLYVLNYSWFETLMFSLPGKIVLAICGTVILVTAMFMMKYTKPIEYKK